MGLQTEHFGAFISSSCVDTFRPCRPFGATTRSMDSSQAIRSQRGRTEASCVSVPLEQPSVKRVFCRERHPDPVPSHVVVKRGMHLDFSLRGSAVYVDRVSSKLSVGPTDGTLLQLANRLSVPTRDDAPTTDMDAPLSPDHRGERRRSVPLAPTQSRSTLRHVVARSVAPCRRRCPSGSDCISQLSAAFARAPAPIRLHS